ncbi:MAG: CDP-alcohol phosphatidyltransferase family protein [Planctomycetales bacterium]|nr:CDP-alcohol phosphatidyltransferase family protein [Planctomycetales bacterium]
MTAKQKKGIIRHIPNALTVGRLVLTVVFLGLIVYAPRTGQAKPANLLLGAFVLFVVTGLTDIVDGYLARKFEATSKFGRTVDPLADKFLVCGAFFCFAWVNQPLMACFDFSEITLDIIRWGTAIIIFAREVIVQTLRHIAENRGVQFGAIWSGKLKMFLQSFGIGTVIIGWAYVSRPWGDWVTLIAYTLMVLVTILSGIQSLTRRIK